MSSTAEPIPYPTLPENFNDDLKDEEGAPMSKRCVLSFHCSVEATLI